LLGRYQSISVSLYK